MYQIATRPAFASKLLVPDSIETAHLERVDCQARDGTLAKTGYVLDLGKVLLLQPGGFHAEDAKDVKLRWVTMRVTPGPRWLAVVR